MIKKAEILLTILLVLCCGRLALDLMNHAGIGGEEQQKGTAAYVERNLTREGAALPAAYGVWEDGKAPGVKDQGALGRCWAVAASSALESRLLPEEYLVFSADHLSMQNSFFSEQEDGGDYSMVMAYLAGWQGPVLEADDPYGDGVSDAGLMPVKHVQEMQKITGRDHESIKQAVYSYGAVQSSIYMDMQNESAQSLYYNPGNYSYYYDGAELPNHDVLIVGWDDNYPASGFSRPAGEDGAFICQNSWGTHFGDNGIFYVSYEDVNLGENCIVYTVIEDADNYDHLYQTDLCGWVGQLGYGDGDCYFANVFEAQGQQTLEAVGFYATGENTEYSIYLAGDAQDLSEILLKEPLASGKMKNIGYYTVPLDQTAVLENGQSYAVVIEIHTPDATAPVATEYVAGELTKTVDISDGEGYISHNGAIWTSTEAEHRCNVCMKVYTKDR